MEERNHRLQSVKARPAKCMNGQDVEEICEGIELKNNQEKEGDNPNIEDEEAANENAEENGNNANIRVRIKTRFRPKGS